MRHSEDNSISGVRIRLSNVRGFRVKIPSESFSEGPFEEPFPISFKKNLAKSSCESQGPSVHSHKLGMATSSSFSHSPYLHFVTVSSTSSCDWVLRSVCFGLSRMSSVFCSTSLKLRNENGERRTLFGQHWSIYRITLPFLRIGRSIRSKL